MWNIFFHIFGECKILCAEILQFSKKGQQKKNFQKFLKNHYFLLAGRRNMIFTLFWEPKLDFAKKKKKKKKKKEKKKRKNENQKEKIWTVCETWSV